MDKRVCTICFHDVDVEHTRLGRELEPFLSGIIKANIPRWDVRNAVCIHCIERFISAQAELDSYLPKGADNLKILPTALRLGASPRFTGRGITIAFLDSGFYWHPDLTRPEVRIVGYVNVFSSPSSFQDLMQSDVSSWHGMMTSVVAAGNGYLSRGIYRGIASNARLVLVKVGSAQRIKHNHITRGLRWIIRHRHEYNIRIVNISCGGDFEASYLHDPLSQAAEEAVKAGLVVIAAAGNAGHQANHAIIPPASAPSVITVGGLDDKNSLDPANDDMYHSSFGPTIDGLQKPELLAPGIWVAAPILPGTPTAAQAQLLDELERTPDTQLRSVITSNPGIDADLDAAAALEPYLVRHLVEIKLRSNNVISSHYKHVDGTSFAAPIVSSIVAQMLEANPYLTPQQVKQILIKTAERIPHVAVDRQGWGVVNPRSAVAHALELKLSHTNKPSAPLVAD
ncbi:MAG: S8 family serine peptidase [Acidobacteriota bacterium]